MSPTERSIKTYADAVANGCIGDADLLLFRNEGLISRTGRGPYSHAAKAAWWGTELFCLEMREFKGGRAVTLRSQIERFDRKIDVFRTNSENRWPEYDCHASTEYMKKLCGTPYGYWPLLSAALVHLPFARLAFPPDFDDKANGRVPFCSSACAAADRIGGGVDPVPHLADSFIEPSDLAHTPFYEYRFTLAMEAGA